MNAPERLTKILSKKILCVLFAGLFASTMGNGFILANEGKSATPQETQQEQIKAEGNVTDKSGEPVIGATVRLASDKKIGTITDLDGNFSLSVPRNALLEIGGVGYKTMQVAVKSDARLSIVLEDNERVLDEIVVVGYDTQRKVNLTGAVGSVNVKQQLEGRPLTDIGRGLQGATPGLTVSTTSGAIGGDPAIKIRGMIGSINGNSAPLILVDNVQISSLSLINPDEVESLSVLKDAASTSIYGTRAAFGVILITTKKAKAGDRFSVDYSSNLSWHKPTTVPKIAKTYETAEMSMLAASRANPAVTEQTSYINLSWNRESIERMKEWERVYGGYKLGPEMVLGRDFDMKDGKLYFYRGFDAMDEFVKDNNFSQAHNLSVNGASGKTTYNLNLGYLGQTGVMKVKTDQFNRYNASFNTSTEINKWLSFRSKLLYSRTELETPFSYTADAYNAWYYLSRWPRIMPYGTYEGIPFHNSVTEAEQANMNSRSTNYTRINLGTTIKLISDLSLDVDYTFTQTNRLTTTRGGEAGGWDFWSTNGLVNRVWTSSAMNKVAKASDFSDYHVANIIARWKKTIKEDHVISAFAGSNIEYFTSNGVSGERRDLVDFNMPEFNLATGDQFSSGYHTQWGVLGFFGRINYLYKNRYLLELNARYDGSSRFPLDQLWGFFPSASAGYILSEENFMKPLKPYLSFAKIRVSWGSIGNQDVGEYRFLPIMGSINSNWIIKDKNEVSFGLPRVIGKGFTWETITTTNFGFDTRFFNDKLGISLDVYQRKNTNMTMQPTGVLPATFGAPAPAMNYGTLDTRGWELSADFRHKFSNGLGLNVTATLSDATIKYAKFDNPTKIVTGSYEGKTYGEIWGYETDRFFTASDFDIDPKGQLVLKPEFATQSYFENLSSSGGWFKYGPGDIKYKDLNGDGEITPGQNTVEDPGDQKVIGNSTPRYEFSARIGLDWKNFDFSTFIQGVGKRNLWGTGIIAIPGHTYMDAWYAHQTDYWTPENPNALYPRPSNLLESNGAQNFFPQTKYLLDMSYCRVKNVTFGYTLPTILLQKANVKKLRVYVSLENLFEIDNLGKMPIDPETGITNSGDGGQLGRSYPYTRTASIGLQISL